MNKIQTSLILLIIGCIVFSSLSMVSATDSQGEDVIDHTYEDIFFGELGHDIAFGDGDSTIHRAYNVTEPDGTTYCYDENGHLYLIFNIFGNK